MKKLVFAALCAISMSFAANVDVGSEIILDGKKVAFHHCDRSIGECHNSFPGHMNQFCQMNGMSSSFAVKAPKVCSDSRLPIACTCVIKEIKK